VCVRFRKRDSFNLSNMPVLLLRTSGIPTRQAPVCRPTPARCLAWVPPVGLQAGCLRIQVRLGGPTTWESNPKRHDSPYSLPPPTFSPPLCPFLPIFFQLARHTLTHTHCSHRITHTHTHTHTHTNAKVTSGGLVSSESVLLPDLARSLVLNVTR